MADNIGSPVLSGSVGPVGIDVPGQGLKFKLIGFMKNGYQANTEELTGVVWSVSDESIARIESNNTIVALRNGIVTLIATVGTLTASATINIGGDLPEPKYLSRIELDRYNIIAGIGTIINIDI